MPLIELAEIAQNAYLSEQSLHKDSCEQPLEPKLVEKLIQQQEKMSYAIKQLNERLNNITTNISFMNSQSNSNEVQKFRTRRGKQFTPYHTNKNFCWYHQAYGPKAKRCGVTENGNSCSYTHKHEEP